MSSSLSSFSSSSTAMVDHQYQFNLMNLPPELRVMVYRFMFEGGVRNRRADHNQKHQLAILRVSKQVHQEALPVAYENVIFHLQPGNNFGLVRSLCWVESPTLRHIHFLTFDMCLDDFSDEMACIALIAILRPSQLRLEKLSFEFTTTSSRGSMLSFGTHNRNFLLSVLKDFSNYKTLRLEGFFKSSLAQSVLQYCKLKPIQTPDHEALSGPSNLSPLIIQRYASERHSIAEMTNPRFQESDAKALKDDHEKDKQDGEVEGVGGIGE